MRKHFLKTKESTESEPENGSVFQDPKWYAAQTRSRHEKVVAIQLRQRNIENFLPLYERISRWKDRRVLLQLPLFDGYIFIRIADRDRMRALETPGISRLVGFGGVLKALKEQEIEALRIQIRNGSRFAPHPQLAAGRQIEIRRGPLAGWSGVLVRQKNQYRLVISVDSIQRSIAVDVDIADVAPMGRVCARIDYGRPSVDAHFQNSNGDASRTDDRIA